jgi:hypothetical protein
MIAENRKLIPRRVFREMQNISTMTQHRREKTLPGYPKPITISNRIFFFDDEIEAYFASLRAGGSPSGSPQESAAPEARNG